MVEYYIIRLEYLEVFDRRCISAFPIYSRIYINNPLLRSLKKRALRMRQSKMDFQNLYNDLFRLDPVIYDASLPPKPITDMTSIFDSVQLECNNNQVIIPGFMWSSPAIQNHFSDSESPICKEDIFLNEFNANDQNGNVISSGPNGQELAPILMSEYCSTDENESPNLPPSSVVPCYELYSPVNDDMLSDTTSTALYESEMSYQKKIHINDTKNTHTVSTPSSCSDDKTDSSVTYSPPLTYEFYQEEKQATHNETVSASNSTFNFSAISFYDEDYDMVSYSNNSNSTELDKTTDMDVSSDCYYKDVNYLCKRLTELLHKLEHHNSTNTTSDSNVLSVIETEYDKEIKHACSFSKSGNHQHGFKTLQLLNSVMDAYLISLQITGSNGDLKALSLSRGNSLNSMDSSEEQHSYDNSDATYSLGFTSSFSIQAFSENEEDGSGGDANDNDDDEDYEFTSRKSKKRARKGMKNKKQKHLGTESGNKVTKKTCRSNNKMKNKMLKEAVTASATENDEYEDDNNESFKKRSRKNYSSDITSILMNWYLRNGGTPPTMAEKVKLANETRKSIGQVSTWFQNARRRHHNKLELFQKYSTQYPNKITDYKSLMKHINATK
ncbi:hypothetical protein K501DRAFT_337715 [Backusella circina FSU 941]|nr:hypothetical protein K501DRAFT_337715 [Backusella circina FSU 941]